MKTIKKQLKRAFTIVELVIVIAVIAVLAAVLIPTFVNVLDSANVSNDTALAKNMNTTLTTYGTLKGKPETPHEALEALEEDGYLLKNMTPTADGYSYIWDQNTNSIALITEDFEIQYSQYDDILTNSDSILWAFVSTQSEVNAFSSSDYTFKYCITSDTALTVDNDFDSYIISNTNVTLSASGKSYTIYTDGGEVTIDAEYATVNHYGDASLVTVTAVDTNSYHVYGEVKMAVLTKGRLVVEDDASISILAINASSSSDVSLEVKTEKVSDAVSTIYATSDNSTISVKTSNDSTYADYNNVITTNAISSGSLSGIAYVSTATEFESFMSGGVGMCVLQESIITDERIYLDEGKFVMIDLNGKTLTNTNSDSSCVTNKSELTISNGTLSFTGIPNTNSSGSISAIAITSNSKLTLNSVEATSSNAMLLPRGDAAEVNVINSEITVDRCYCVSTNAANENNYNVVINLESSTFNATQRENGDTCAICFNVPGVLNITNCTITGKRQGVVVRAGTATITNTTIICTGEYTGTSYYTSSDWNSGDEVPMGALIIGNRKGTYAGDATVNCYGVTLNYQGNENGFYVYMYGGVVYNTTGSTEPNKAILNYDSACNLGTITQGEEKYTVINKI